MVLEISQGCHPSHRVTDGTRKHWSGFFVENITYSYSTIILFFKKTKYLFLDFVSQ